MIAVYETLDGSLGPPGIRTSSLVMRAGLEAHDALRLRDDCAQEGWINTHRATYPGECAGPGFIELTPKGRDMAEESIIERKKAQRLRFLNHLHDATGGDIRAHTTIAEVASAIGIDMKEARSAYDYLLHEGLIEPRGLGGIVSISHHGIREIEAARSGTSTGTTHFPVTVINNVFHNTGTITGSNVQQAGDHAQQTVTELTPDLLKRIEKLLSDLKNELAQAQFDEKPYVEADAKAIEDELALPKPRPSVVKSRLSQIYDAIAAGVVSSGVVEGLKALIALLA